MKCVGCGNDIPAMTRICPYCGLDYKEYNKASVRSDYGNFS